VPEEGTPSRVSSLPPAQPSASKSQVAKLFQNPHRKRIVSPAAAMPFKKGHKGHPRKSLGSKSRHIPRLRHAHQPTLTPSQKVPRL